MNIEYYTDPKFKKTEIIKMVLFFPIFGALIYLISLTGIVDSFLMLTLLIIPIGLVGIWQIAKNSKNRPSVTITDTGLKIFNPFELEEIKWNEIIGIRIENKLNRQILYLDLKNEAVHKSVFNKFLNKLTNTKKEKLNSHVAIMEKYVSYKVDEMKSIIEGKKN